jgi:hypothetical protein
VTDQKQQPREIVMNPIRHVRRFAAALAGLAGALLALAAAAPAAFARPVPPPPPPGSGWYKHPPLPPRGYYAHYVAHQGAIPVPGHTVVIGGMPGWQIALIAIGAALLAATGAVLAYRAWTARRRPAPAAA